MRVKNAKKNVKNARGKVDKAQSALILQNAKKISALEESIEDKYNYTFGTEIPVESLDMSTATGRTRGIIPVRIGTQQGLYDVDSRIGDMINVKTINFKYNLRIVNGAASAAQSVNRVRVLVFWDNDCVKVDTVGTYIANVPQWQQILQSVRTTSPAEDSSVILSPYDHDKRNRFNFLYDEVHTLCPILNGNTTGPGSAMGLGSRSATNSNSYNRSYKIGRKLRYTGGGMIPNNRQLYIAFISDTQTGYPNPQVNYSLKNLYQDA